MNETCHGCGKVYRWDNDADAFIACEEVPLIATLKRDSITDEFTGRDISLFVCDCGATLAVSINDKIGGTLYTPCTKDL